MSVLLAIYNPENGEIIRRVTCSNSMASQQVQEGEAAIEVPRGTIFNDTTHIVDTSGDEIRLVDKQQV